uniref:Uncharacterized protein n=1 Tax=Rhizophora mucronata TaxID=61149 RepID=A0A2P2Q257_RHIMU
MPLIFHSDGVVFGLGFVGLININVFSLLHAVIILQITFSFYISHYLQILNDETWEE